MYPFGVHTPMLRYIQYHFTLLRAFLQVNERKSLFYPLIGMLMIPKTCAYVWTVLIGYNAMKAELGTNH